jgi:type II secretory pathway pseudopilin PulG
MRRRSNHGITLLETLVSLAVMAIIALSLSYGMTAMLTFSDRTKGHTEDIAEIAARQLARAIIERAATVPFPGFDFVGMQGTSTSVTVESWYSEPPFWPGAPVLLTLSADPTGTMSSRIAAYDESRTPFEMDQQIGPAGGISIRYFGQVPGDVAATWHSEWKSSDGLPQLIEITSGAPSSAFPPTAIRPGRSNAQSEISLSSLVPPALPSRP